jgi:hypothetical protein
LPPASRGGQDIGARIAMFLRSHYPQHRAKTIARTFGVSISTAQRWLDGYPPTIRHFEQMYEVWGVLLIKFTFPDYHEDEYNINNKYEIESLLIEEKKANVEK